MFILRNGIAALLVTAIVFSLTTGVGATSDGGATASSGVTPSPSPSIPFSFAVPSSAAKGDKSKVLFILAVGADSATRQKAVALLGRELQTNQTALMDFQTGSQKMVDSTLSLVLEPDWSVSDYITACSNVSDSVSPVSSISGALIIGLDGVVSYTDERFIWRDNRTAILGTLLYSICEPPATPSPTPPPPPPKRRFITKSITTIEHSHGMMKIRYAVRATASPRPTSFPKIVWQSNEYQGDGTVWYIEFLNVMGLTATGVAAWAAFTPSVTRSTVNTYAYPTPVPGATVPPGGVLSGSQTTNQKVTNAAQLSSIATGILGPGLTFQGNLTTIPTADKQSVDALSHMIGQFIDKLECPINDTPTFRREPRHLPLQETGALCKAILSGQRVEVPPGGAILRPADRKQSDSNP
jgi:hypothetical protein